MSSPAKNVPIFLLLLQLLFPVNNVSGSSILFFHLLSTSSHRSSIWPLAEELAERGHKVTYIFPSVKRTGSHPKVEEVIPSKPIQILTNFGMTFDTNIRLNNSVFMWTIQVFSKSVELCEAFYDSPETQKWLSTPGLKYDLIMIDSSLGECAYGLVDRFKAKHILFSPLLPPFLHDGFGIVPESASTPEMFFHKKPEAFGFMDRLVTTFSYLFWRLCYLDWFNKVHAVIQNKMSLTELPTISEFEKNTSLLLINTHFVEDYPLALPPNFQTYSGLWCPMGKGETKKNKTEKALPQELASFIKDVDSFVYVSFGSSVVPSTLPENMQKMFFQAFASFPKVKFIWRWPGAKAKDVPQNVMLQSWLPQLDLLAHPKIKGFIMQGGRPSTQEALCHAVPMITIPFFADQDYNADRMGLIGGAINLDISSLSQAQLEESLKQVLTNSSYAERMRELSKMFRDRPIAPLTNVVYWTEYVLRHDTSLMKPLGMNYTWYQRRLLDVYAAAFAVVIAVIGVALGGIHFTLKLCLGRKKASKTKSD